MKLSFFALLTFTSQVLAVSTNQNSVQVQHLGMVPKPPTSYATSLSCKLDGSANTFVNLDGQGVGLLSKHFGNQLLTTIPGMSVNAFIDQACSNMAATTCVPQPQVRQAKIVVNGKMFVVDVDTLQSSLISSAKRKVAAKANILSAISFPKGVAVPKVGQTLTLGSNAKLRVASATSVVFTVGSSSTKIDLNIVSATQASKVNSQTKVSTSLPPYMSLSLSLSLDKSAVTNVKEATWC